MTPDLSYDYCRVCIYSTQDLTWCVKIAGIYGILGPSWVLFTMVWLAVVGGREKTKGKDNTGK